MGHNILRCHTFSFRAQRFPFSRGRGWPSGRVTVKLVAWWHLRESCACIACLYSHVEWHRIIAFHVDGESQTGRRPQRVSRSLCRRGVRGASRSLSVLSRRTPRHLSVARSATLLPSHPTAKQIDWPCHGRKPIVTIMSLLWKQIFFAKINRTASTVYGEFVFFCILVTHTRAPFSRSPMPTVLPLPLRPPNGSHPTYRRRFAEVDHIITLRQKWAMQCNNVFQTRG